jgi:F-type H+-transporting ATPase subunit epsilon
MILTIAQIDKVLWAGDAESLSLPGEDGVMTILSHHMPLITPLVKGVVTVKTKDGAVESFSIAGGMLEVGKNETVVLVS